jgi:nucleotide-binding universal stress UspA family protein
MFKKILVPTDGSDLATQAAVRAVPLAKMAGASLMVVYVQGVYPYTGVGEANAAASQAFVAAGRAEGLRAVQRIAEVAKAQGIPFESLVVESDQVANGIVEAAQQSQAELIAMGSHGRSGMAKVMLGSVAAKVLALSPIPVLIFKQADVSAADRS